MNGIQRLFTLFLLFTVGLVSQAQETPRTIDFEQWSIHGQATSIAQGHGQFRSPYSGDNSLPGHSESYASYTTTLYLGRRLWSGAEIYVNPELSGGRGIGDVSGIAAYPNGDLVHVNGHEPAVNLARVFLRQTFDFGIEAGRVEPAQNQLAGYQSTSRLTLTLGRLTPSDLFDNNSYAHDPRTQFMNWALVDNGAWDYPANAHDYTWGGVIDYNQPRWALRYGLFMVPTGADNVHFDHNFGHAQSHVLELELRYDLWNRPGKLRVLGFWNRANMGNFREALDSGNPDLAIEDVRRYSSKRGAGINLEQELAEGLGAFSRLGWNDGQTETLGFTDINQTFSLGLSLKGGRWHRVEDQVGLAGVINGLSTSHRDFLAAGGTSLIIGDGKLNYAHEEIMELYYSLKISTGIFATADYQFINHPGYNHDRGPVSVWGLRLHAEF